MARRHADGLAVTVGGTTAQTWAAVRGTQMTLDQLCQALFTGLATEAGIPAPTRVNGSIASYGEAGLADALAARAREVVGPGVGRFDTDRVQSSESRHCVSLGL